MRIEYKLQEWNGGKVWVEEAYPNILFAKDGEIYDIAGMKTIVIGGAYSVDKFYRLSKGYNWFEDEQPSDEIKAYVEKQLSNEENRKRGGGGTIHFMDELPEYKEISDKYREEEKRLEEYRRKCKDEAIDMFKQYFYDLWD